MRPSTKLGSIAILATLALSACSAESDKRSGTANTGGGASTAAARCTPSSLKTQTSGTLTVATDSPAFDPWFSDDKPSNGKGFESAVAFAVAKQLGYSPTQVKWVVAPFKTVIAPTPKKFDFDINQVSITPARAKVVDFSTGYYDVAQAVITLKGSKIAGVTTIAGLRNAKLGAQKGTTSLDAINNVIKPSRTVGEYPTNDVAVQALKNGQVDGLVVDLPTGLFITAAELDNGQLVGQLPVTGTPEQFGLVLDKGSSLTTCVRKAVDALRSDGTLAALQKQWLTSSAGAPELT
ncbi:MAG: amino acid ABC transporter substrate-binding protein [Pseudonocardiales bacterium]|nr:MAG: amino acid ABC transporter substrate-binding protein [Pseudonocardiales bacterium]